jgi:hypothetical protein
MTLKKKVCKNFEYYLIMCYYIKVDEYLLYLTIIFN